MANVTATSGELVDALKEHSRQEPTAYTLVVPATPFGGGRAAATEQLDTALGQLHEAGLEASGHVGHADPIVAVTDAWDPKRFDEIVVSTLPMRFSKWLHAGLPERIGRITGAPITHIISQPHKHTPEVEPAPPHQKEPLGPLSVLGWGGHKEE